jgi:pimeloyl-ACP methyl ester carboxylesterase
MTEIRHHTVHANGIRQHFLEAGKGAPIVLLHGFPETSFAWRALARVGGARVVSVSSRPTCRITRSTC